MYAYGIGLENLDACFMFLLSFHVLCLLRVIRYCKDIRAAWYRIRIGRYSSVSVPRFYLAFTFTLTRGRWPSRQLTMTTTEVSSITAISNNDVHTSH